MSLAVLKLNKSKQLKESERKALIDKREEYRLKGEELENSISEAENEEDLALIEEEIAAHVDAVNETDTAIENLSTEIEGLEGEISEVENKVRSAVSAKERKETIKTQNRSDTVMSDENVIYRVKNNVERRERMRKALEHEDMRARNEGKDNSELRGFFEKIQNSIKTRAIAEGGELLIPEILINMIEIDMQFIGGITNLITLRPVGGTTRIVMSGDAPEALWIECCDPISELNKLSFNMIELDCFKLAGFLAVCNATLEDAFINLASHIQEQMVKGFKFALDRSVLSGKGSAFKQPEGIIPAIPTDHVVSSSPLYSKYLMNYELLPDDAVIEAAVMTRATYFRYFMAQTVQVNSNGQIVVANMRNPVMPDGTPVVFVRKDSEMLEDGQVLTGQFSKYFMAQRAGMTIDTSTHVKFLDDQTVFRIIGRFDGKPLKPEYFLLINIEEDEE